MHPLFMLKWGRGWHTGQCDLVKIFVIGAGPPFPFGTPHAQKGVNNGGRVVKYFCYQSITNKRERTGQVLKLTFNRHFIILIAVLNRR
jgi:hypothetical protein